MLDMKKLERKAYEYLDKVKKYFVGNEIIESKSSTIRKQRLNRVILVAVIIIAIGLIIAFLASDEEDKIGEVGTDSSLEKLDLKDASTIELATDATKASTRWQNFLEESIEQEGHKRQSQIELLKESINTSTETSKAEHNKEFDEIKSRLAYALNEIDRMKGENSNMQNDLSALSSKEGAGELPAELGITSIYDDIATSAPVSSYNYIPATSYVSGNLLGGIAVSTSVTAATEPIPVVIQLTGRGNLPKDFAVDIKQCRLLGSCYGDISSERAVIRAEELICENKKAGLIISTKVAGVIYGDDGANGIRGTVVSMSEKHLKNAFVGGMLSGFANTAGGRGSYNITSLGAISTKKQGMNDVARDGLTAGTSSAAEKLADYHIKLAENISPVILIPGGTRVDVMFTKSVEIGSLNVEDAINQERGKKNGK